MGGYNLEREQRTDDKGEREKRKEKRGEGLTEKRKWSKQEESKNNMRERDKVREREREREIELTQSLPLHTNLHLKCFNSLPIFFPLSQPAAQTFNTIVIFSDPASILSNTITTTCLTSLPRHHRQEETTSFNLRGVCVVGELQEDSLIQPHYHREELSLVVQYAITGSVFYHCLDFGEASRTVLQFAFNRLSLLTQAQPRFRSQM